MPACYMHYSLIATYCILSFCRTACCLCLAKQEPACRARQDVLVATQQEWGHTHGGYEDLFCWVGQRDLQLAGIASSIALLQEGLY